jgi:DNA sulfur modification protein DndC
LEGFVEAGFAEFEPLLEFRDWLASIRDAEGRRTIRRRNGQITYMASGDLVRGPFTIDTRREILRRLLELQSRIGRDLISSAEITRIRALWAEDVATYAERGARRGREPLLVSSP